MSTFKSLHIRNYRVWFLGALVSNVGTWMQRTAQDWLVFDHLSNHDAGAMGITLALQMGPQLFLAPWAGLLADRYNRRHLLFLTQGIMALLSTGLGILVVAGAGQLWHVYVFALLLGLVSALDAPVRQTFVSELVGEDSLANAVALNSASFNVARMIGPAVAGVLTVVVGPGWVFLLNTVTFLVMILALASIPAGTLRVQPRAAAGKGRIREGLRYVRHRRDIVVVLVAIFIMGTLGLNFVLFIAAMVGTEFGMDAGAFWSDFKFSLRHLKDFSRCAIVSDTKWFSPLSALAEPFIDCEVAYFQPEDLEAARNWLFWPDDVTEQI